MKLSGPIVLASLSLNFTPATRAEDATTPIDYTQRNAPFAPAATVAPGKKAPPVDEAVQDKRVGKTIIDKQPAAVGDRRAALDVQEARDKNIREKDSHRPEAREQPLSQFNHREASFATATDTKQPPLVAKYQDSLTAASASNMARFPARDGATVVKLNRFVFRRNAPDSPAILDGTTVTPAAGGSPMRP